MNTKADFRKIFRIIFILIAWYALVGHFFQIVLHRAPEMSALSATISYFSYFTIQSNWLVVIWWMLAVFNQGRNSQPFFLTSRVKGALTAYITVTFSVYAALLADMWQPAGFALQFATITHYITPLAFILDWLLFEKRGTYQWRWGLEWLIYPVAYFIYALTYGAIINKALYPFFDHAALGWGRMFVQVLFLLAFFIGLAGLYIAANRLLGRWFPSPAPVDSESQLGG